MYLSRVEIDRNNRRKIRDLTHLGAYHNWVEQSFPDEIEAEKRTRKLWRIDKLYGREYLLIVSEEIPDHRELERYGVEGTAETKDYDEFLNSLEVGMKAKFRAKLNPVFSKSNGKDQRGKVIPLASTESQMEYLLGRAKKHGFHLEPDEFTIVGKGTELLKHKGKRAVPVKGAEYEGVLTITDLEKFKKVLTEGLGKKRAYGCGMVTVIPYR